MRSSSWALINRPDRSWFCSAVTRNRCSLSRSASSVRRRRIRCTTSPAISALCTAIISMPPMMYGLVQLPGAELPEQDRAVRRKARFTDVPAAELAPVELGGGRIDLSDCDVLRSFALHHAQSQSCHARCGYFRSVHRPANESVIQSQGVPAVGRRIRCRAHALQHFLRQKQATLPVLRHAHEENDRMRRQR